MIHCQSGAKTGQYHNISEPTPDTHLVPLKGGQSSSSRSLGSPVKVNQPYLADAGIGQISYIPWPTMPY